MLRHLAHLDPGLASPPSTAAAWDAAADAATRQLDLSTAALWLPLAGQVCLCMARMRSVLLHIPNPRTANFDAHLCNRAT